MTRMQKVKVKTAELLAKVQENRNNHRTQFEKAMDIFRADVIEELDRMIRDAKAGKEIRRIVNLPPPEDHTEDYDCVINMLKMSVDQEVELTNHEFSQYVMDNWQWSQAVTQSFNRYLNKSGA